MSRRNEISTGLAHQRDVAIWVRRRLVDRHGGCFDTGRRCIEQYGVLLADGVGLGKTWEALAAAALLLIERGKERAGGGQRQNVRKQAARVLVLCPPGLVSKWSREIRDPEGFTRRLARWGKRRADRNFVLRTLTKPFEIRRKSDLDDSALAGKLRRARVELPEGVYVCNWNVLRKGIGSGRSRLAALRAQPWDVLIVDEAHHREGREAIGTIRKWARALRATILLTATPFQLEPRELHELFESILDNRHREHRVLSRAPVREFVAALAEFFQGDGPAPARSLKTQAERVLSQAIARTQVRGKGRKFHIIDANGAAIEIPPPDHMRDDDLRQLFPTLVEPRADFEAWYLKNRLALAARAPDERTFIPTKLRQALSTPSQARQGCGQGAGGGPPYSPRLHALASWARNQFTVDLRRSMEDGLPRKTLVFTSFVGHAAREIREALAGAVDQAWRAARREPQWRAMSASARKGVERVAGSVEAALERLGKRYDIERTQEGQRVLDALHDLASRPEPGATFDLFGHRRFQNRVTDDLTRRLEALATVVARANEGGDWERRLHREERRNVRATIDALGRSTIVRTYTGRDDRRERDAAGEAFRSPLAPWVLVASNVGSEGIDLHTFSSQLVHFDIEWNPARMEQREGRTDRFGRQIKEPVNVYFTLVRGTYDERMLQQLVARQRWHSVLLGRPGARIARDKNGVVQARLLEEGEARMLSLDLRPNW